MVRVGAVGSPSGPKIRSQTNAAFTGLSYSSSRIEIIKSIHLLAFLIILVLSTAVKGGKVERLGTYDSRAIAVAFVGSEVFYKTEGKVIAQKMAEYKKAEANGNEAKAARLKAWGQARQSRLHQQGFGTLPVDDILKHIKDQIPGIKKAGQVDLLVSKWEKGVLEKYKDAEQVNLTMKLIEALRPNKLQKKRALEIQKNEPVSPEKLKEEERLIDGASALKEYFGPIRTF